MTGRMSTAVTVIAVLAAAVVFLFTRDYLVPLVLCAVAVASWAFSPAVLDDPAGIESGGVDPAAVKRYRHRHPGATIPEAARAVTDRRD